MENAHGVDPIEGLIVVQARGELVKIVQSEEGCNQHDEDQSDELYSNGDLIVNQL